MSTTKLSDRIDSITLYQGEDAWKEGSGREPNYMRIDIKDDLMIIDTQRFALDIRDLKELIRILKANNR